jgi:hypothetical protein
VTEEAAKGGGNGSPAAGPDGAARAGPVV